MKHNNKLILSIKFLVLILLSACTATQPTIGQQIQLEGEKTQKIGQAWSEGEKLIAEGNILIKSGHKEINKGDNLASAGASKVKKGEALVRKGTRLKIEAEEAYHLSN